MKDFTVTVHTTGGTQRAISVDRADHIYSAKKVGKLWQLFHYLQPIGAPCAVRQLEFAVRAHFKANH